MKIGTSVANMTMPGGAPQLGQHLAEIARAADDAGLASLWVMDHFFQIDRADPARANMEMLEGYTTLAFMAAHTRRIRLGTMVTGVTYRYPGLLAKTITTLDVLSGGRAWLGIGAAWYEREHLGLGVPFPPVKERFERLEEALQICLEMWSPGAKPYNGKHYQLRETINSPQPVTQPRPPILIGGSGEKKTLRLVAKYGDACNIQGDAATLRHKLDVLREHCQAVGRRYEDIEKTSMLINWGSDPFDSSAMVDQLGALAELGIQHVICGLPDIWNLKALESIGRDVLPQVAKL